jgi:hypothetical protein
MQILKSTGYYKMEVDTEKLTKVTMQVWGIVGNGNSRWLGC